MLLFVQQVVSQQDTSVILEKAYEQAKLENKNVFVFFKASWCKWCKRMDSNMKAEDVKDIFNRNYVFIYLTVHEAKGKIHLENPGALDLLKKYKAEKSGIPFFLIFDNNGKFLADSFDSNGQNLGCPASEAEVVEFKNILKETSNLTDAELKSIEDRFVLKN